MLGTPERRNILFALFYVGLKGLDSHRGHGSFEGKGVLRREKPGQRRGRDVVGHSVEVPRMLRDRYGHQVLLGTGWHALTGAAMEMQWWSPSDLSYLNPDAAGGTADGDHPASAISTKG